MHRSLWVWSWSGHHCKAEFEGQIAFDIEGRKTGALMRFGLRYHSLHRAEECCAETCVRDDGAYEQGECDARDKRRYAAEPMRCAYDLSLALR